MHARTRAEDYQDSEQSDDNNLDPSSESIAPMTAVWSFVHGLMQASGPSGPRPARGVFGPQGFSSERVRISRLTMLTGGVLTGNATSSRQKSNSGLTGLTRLTPELVRLTGLSGQKQ